MVFPSFSSLFCLFTLFFNSFSSERLLLFKSKCLFFHMILFLILDKTCHYKEKKEKERKKVNKLYTLTCYLCLPHFPLFMRVYSSAAEVFICSEDSLRACHFSWEHYPTFQFSKKPVSMDLVGFDFIHGLLVSSSAFNAFLVSKM